MSNTPVASSVESKTPRFFYGYVIVLAAFTVMAVVAAGFNSFSVFLKPIVADFGFTRAMASGAYSLCMLAYGILSIVTGRLTDRFGSRILVTAGGFSFGLGYVLISQMSSLWQLYVLYGVLIGFGMSCGFVPMTSTVAKWFVKRRGVMTGIVTSGVGAGFMIGPFVSSNLMLSYGWRNTYFVIGIISLILLVLASQFLRRDPRQKDQLPYGHNNTEQDGLILEDRGFFLPEAIVTKQFWLLCIMFTIAGFIMLSIVVHVVANATDMGISTIAAANILTVFGGANIAGRIGIGHISDRIGSKRSFLIGFSLLLVSSILLYIARELWMFYILAVVFGLGIGGFVAMQPLSVAESFGLKSHGLILGILQVGFTTGGAIGPVIAGYLFDISGNYYLFFTACAALAIIALTAGLALRKQSYGKFYREPLSSDSEI
ncbi:MFS transporter [Chloroflexota bacterium]